MPVDLRGNELKIGQKVVSTEPNYRSLAISRVVSVTERTVLLKRGEREFRRLGYDVCILEDVK